MEEKKVHEVIKKQALHDPEKIESHKTYFNGLCELSKVNDPHRTVMSHNHYNSCKSICKCCHPKF